MKKVRKTARAPARPGTPPPYEYFEERRRYPRALLRHAGILAIRGAEQTCVIHDVSPDGIQIRCTRGTMQAMQPSGRAIKGDAGPVVAVAFTLPIGAREQLLAVSVRLYYFVLLPDGKPLDVATGARFMNLSPAARRHLDEFFREVLQPAADPPPRS